MAELQTPLSPSLSLKIVWNTYSSIVIWFHPPYVQNTQTLPDWEFWSMPLSANALADWLILCNAPDQWRSMDQSEHEFVCDSVYTGGKLWHVCTCVCACMHLLPRCTSSGKVNGSETSLLICIESAWVLGMIFLWSVPFYFNKQIRPYKRDPSKE